MIAIVSPGLDRVAGRDQQLPDAAAERRLDQLGAVGNVDGRAARRVVGARSGPRPGRTRRCASQSARSASNAAWRRAWKAAMRLGVLGQEGAIVGEAEVSSSISIARRPSGKSRRHSVSSSWLTGKKRIWSKKRSSHGLPSVKASVWR